MKYLVAIRLIDGGDRAFEQKIFEFDEQEAREKFIKDCLEPDKDIEYARSEVE